jgi:hypothetical protein
MEAMETMEDMADGTRDGGLPRGGDDRWERADKAPNPEGKASPELCGGMGLLLQGDEDLTWGGEEEAVPLEEVVL